MVSLPHPLVALVLFGSAVALASEPTQDLPNPQSGVDRFGNSLALYDGRSGTRVISMLAGEPCQILGRRFGTHDGRIERFWFDSAEFTQLYVGTPLKTR
ncbi:MAG: hypothetical protein AAF602_15805, partial [Myxococcota bacterium]